MKVCLDANCFIDAFNSKAPTHDAMINIFRAGEEGKLKLCVSLQTLAELEVKPDRALELARSVESLAHYPIGNWEEQVATWDQAAGTWYDAKVNDEHQEHLRQLAKSGNDVRDRGAFIDALRSGCKVFVTSDRQFASPQAAFKIREAFGVEILTPEVLAQRL